MKNNQSVILDISDNIVKELDTVRSTAGYSQSIDKPTHLTNHSFSCIDLIFTRNPNIPVDSGIARSLCSSCHHDIIYGKIIYRVPFFSNTFHDYLGLQRC